MESKLQPEEYVDVVNEHDELLRTMPLLDVRRIGFAGLAESGEYVRAICAFIKNGKGQLWIPRRCEAKKVFPLALDIGISGFVSAGETYQEAFVREAAEEANIDVRTMTTKHLGLLHPHTGAGCFTDAYEIDSDETPDYNREDFCDSYWLYPQELLELLPNERPVKGGLAVAIKTFYGE